MCVEGGISRVANAVYSTPESVLSHSPSGAVLCGMGFHSVLMWVSVGFKDERSVKKVYAGK